jgi:hypothetical protein
MRGKSATTRSHDANGTRGGMYGGIGGAEEASCATGCQCSASTLQFVDVLHVVGALVA